MSMLAINIFFICANPLFLIKHCIVSANHWKSIAGIFANVKYLTVIIHICIKTSRHTLAGKAKR